MPNNTDSTEGLKISVVESQDGALMSLAGAFNIDSSPTLRNRLLAILKSRRYKRVSVDLFAITHIDSSGVATLIEALKVAHAFATELTLQGLHDEIRRLFEFSGILALFTGSSRTVGQSASEVV